MHLVLQDKHLVQRNGISTTVAQADASVFAQFENQNLSNRQQRAMLAAQQRAQFIGHRV